MAIDLVLDGAETAAQPTALAPEVTTESVLAEVEQLTPEEQRQVRLHRHQNPAGRQDQEHRRGLLAAD